MKFLYLLMFVLLTIFTLLCVHPNLLSKSLCVQNNISNPNDSTKAVYNQQALLQNTQAHVGEAYTYALQHHLNTSFCMLVDMHIASGKNRLFVYNFSQHKITASVLVAHGSCNYSFLSNAQFSNQPGCGCTSFGKYKIGGKYNGRFGAAYKLYGLDSSNSNAFKRNIVLHSYDGVPEKEVHPMLICNSLGCVMVSPNSLKLLSDKIDTSKRPVLLWVLY